MDDDGVPIEFPADVVDTVTDWLRSDDASVGACLLAKTNEQFPTACSQPAPENGLP